MTPCPDSVREPLSLPSRSTTAGRLRLVFPTLVSLVLTSAPAHALSLSCAVSRANDRPHAVFTILILDVGGANVWCQRDQLHRHALVDVLRHGTT